MFSELTYKIPLQYKVFMQHMPTKEQIQQAYYTTGLSDSEIMIIHAYAYQRAIERIDISVIDQYKLDHEYYWVKSWGDISADDYGRAINHLVEICNWYSTNGLFYWGEWMLEAENIIYARLMDFLHKGNRTYTNKEDIKQRIGDI